MKLQVKFDETREYVAKRYSDVTQDVYLNRDYMFDLYLPGILLSQYLWPHHYRQILFFRQEFVSLASEAGAKVFHDVGVGTGFYSKELLRGVPGIQGRGYDISPFSLEHTRRMVESWGIGELYETHEQNILLDPPGDSADCVVSVEVLEHLEDPLAFLKGLRAMLRPQGLGFITAAVNAPNADHIYLYRSLEEVEDQVREAGFTVLKSARYVGYDPASGKSVPENAICIVQGKE